MASTMLSACKFANVIAAQGWAKLTVRQAMGVFGKSFFSVASSRYCSEQRRAQHT